eukprot:6582537-Pyramimonas_sp.AAC.2
MFDAARLTTVTVVSRWLWYPGAAHRGELPPRANVRPRVRRARHTSARHDGQFSTSDRRCELDTVGGNRCNETNPVPPLRTLQPDSQPVVGADPLWRWKPTELYSPAPYVTPPLAHRRNTPSGGGDPQRCTLLRRLASSCEGRRCVGVLIPRPGSDN